MPSSPQFENIPLGPIGPTAQPQNVEADAGLAAGNGHPSAPKKKKIRRCTICCIGASVIVGIIALTMLVITVVAGQRGSPPYPATTTSAVQSTTAVARPSTMAHAVPTITKPHVGLPTATHAPGAKRQVLLTALQGGLASKTSAATTATAAMNKMTTTAAAKAPHRTVKPRVSSTSSKRPAEETLGMLQSTASSRVSQAGILGLLAFVATLFLAL